MREKERGNKMNERPGDAFAHAMFGRDRHGSVCVTCGGEIGEFRNEVSQREFKISGMCQKCQDSTFGEN